MVPGRCSAFRLPSSMHPQSFKCIKGLAVVRLDGADGARKPVREIPRINTAHAASDILRGRDKVVDVSVFLKKNKVRLGSFCRHEAMLLKPIQSIFEQTGPRCFGMRFPSRSIPTCSHRNTSASNDHRATPAYDFPQFVVGIWWMRWHSSVTPQGSPAPTADAAAAGRVFGGGF